MACSHSQGVQTPPGLPVAVAHRARQAPCTEPRLKPLPGGRLRAPDVGARRAGPCRPVASMLDDRAGIARCGDPEAVWQSLRLLKRELDVSVKEENYLAASRLRDEIKALTETLPVAKQYLLQVLDKLRTGSQEERLRVVHALGEAGDQCVVPELATLLHDQSLQSATESAMWKIFMRSEDSSIDNLMQRGAGLLSTWEELPRCLEIFEEVIRRRPSFVEGFNKRATVHFLMHQYRKSIEDCEVVVEAQPYHFGALAGMGLCYFQMGEYSDAAKAFERALLVHPGMMQIQKLLELSRQHITEEQ